MRSTPVQGTIGALLGSVAIDAGQSGTVGIRIAGTFSATLVFEATLDGENWDAVPAYTAEASPTVVTGATAAGLWQCSTAGFTQFRVNCPATYVSGAATVTLTPSARPMRTASPPSAPTNALTAEDGATYLVAEDGETYLTQES